MCTTEELYRLQKFGMKITPLLILLSMNVLRYCWRVSHEISPLAAHQRRRLLHRCVNGYCLPWQEFTGSQSLIQRKITRPKQFLLPVCFLRHRERSQEFSLLRVLWSYPTAIISMVSWPLGKGWWEPFKFYTPESFQRTGQAEWALVLMDPSFQLRDQLIMMTGAGAVA